MSLFCINKKSAIAGFVFFTISTSIGADLTVYPFEPIVIPITHQTNHLNDTYFTNVVISCPGGVIKTNNLGRMHLLGINNGNSMFLLIDSRTNYFCTPGTYQVTIEEVLNTVTVLAPVDADINVIPVLENMTLYEIMFNRGRGELNDDLKNKCQQIISLAPAGHYAIYAKAYLAVDGLFLALEAMYGKPNEPDFSTIGGEILSLPVPENNIKWMVLFNKGMAFGIRRDKQNMRTSFTTLTNGIQNSVWSNTAEKYLLSTQ